MKGVHRDLTFLKDVSVKFALALKPSMILGSSSDD